jgi:hypothetical protein
LKGTGSIRYHSFIKYLWLLKGATYKLLDVTNLIVLKNHGSARIVLCIGASEPALRTFFLLTLVSKAFDSFEENNRSDEVKGFIIFH